VPEAAGKARKVRVYSTPAMLQNLDQRTREARLMRETEAALIAHVGGKPSATQKVLIERAVRLTLQLAMMDAKQAGSKQSFTTWPTEGCPNPPLKALGHGVPARWSNNRNLLSLTEHDGRQYLAWTNTLTRLIRQLGLAGAPARVPTLPEYLATRAAQAPA